jgi:hypothetical protein
MVGLHKHVVWAGPGLNECVLCQSKVHFVRGPWQVTASPASIDAL